VQLLGNTCNTMVAPIINNLFYFTDNNADTRQNWHFLLRGIEETRSQTAKPGIIPISIPIPPNGADDFYFGSFRANDSSGEIFPKCSLIFFTTPAVRKRAIVAFGNEAFVVMQILFTCKPRSSRRLRIIPRFYLRSLRRNGMERVR